MTDLIDRQAALKAVFWDGDAQKNIEDLPTIEVVRCRNCKYFSEPNSFSGKCTLRGDYIFTNDFCSYAIERRTDE